MVLSIRWNVPLRLHTEFLWLIALLTNQNFSSKSHGLCSGGWLAVVALMKCTQESSFNRFDWLIRGVNIGCWLAGCVMGGPQVRSVLLCDWTRGTDPNWSLSIAVLLQIKLKSPQGSWDCWSGTDWFLLWLWLLCDLQWAPLPLGVLWSPNFWSTVLQLAVDHVLSIYEEWPMLICSMCIKSQCLPFFQTWTSTAHAVTAFSWSTSSKRTSTPRRSSVESCTWSIWQALRKWALFPFKKKNKFHPAFESSSVKQHWIFNRSAKLVLKELSWMRLRTSTNLSLPWEMWFQLWQMAM